MTAEVSKLNWDLNADGSLAVVVSVGRLEKCGIGFGSITMTPQGNLVVSLEIGSIIGYQMHQQLEEVALSWLKSVSGKVLSPPIPGMVN